MDSSAIQAIGDLAIAAAKANRLDTPTPAVILNNQVVSLEHLQGGRSRFRGKFATSTVSEFVAYVKANAGGQGFIDAKACAAKVFLNLGDAKTPGHADWYASLALEPTAAYASLKLIEGKPQTQKALVEWVEDWAANLQSQFNGKEPTGIAAGIAALREIKIATKTETQHVDKDFGGKRSAMEEIEATAAGAAPPSFLIFTAEPYAGFQARDFRLRVSIITGEKPAIVLRTVGRELIEEDIAREFKSRLLEEVGDSATLTIGSFAP